MSNSYHVTVQSTQPENPGSLAFDLTSHEDILALVEAVKAKGLFSPQETETFVVGLKLFTSVLLPHRQEPLFADFAPHFGQWMKKLKSL